MSFKYDGLSISSGGLKGLQILGALSYLDFHNYLDDIKWFSGCSVGGLITLLLAVGWRPTALYQRCVNIALFTGMGSIDLQNLKDKFGLIKNDHLKSEFETLIIEVRSKKHARDKWLPTLLDLHNEGIYIAFTIVDQRTKKGHRIDYVSHPNLLASDGALMSGNIPLIFRPIEFEGMHVIDGALVNPFPVEYLDRFNRKNQRRGNPTRLKILGIVVYGLPNPEDTSFMSYVADTSSIPIEEMQRMIIKTVSHHVDILEMSVHEIGLLSLNSSHSLKNDLFFAGFRDGKTLVNAIQNGNPPPKKRRKSSKSQVRTPIRQFPKDLLLKCLMSQPMDILCQASLTGTAALQSCISLLHDDKRERLENFARQIVKDRGGSYVKYEPAKPDPKYESTDKVHIREDYSSKLYDSMPIQFKAAAKVMVDSLPPEKASQTLRGFNIIIEGLNHLGIDIFSGFMLADGPASPRQEIDGRVEIIEDVEPKRSMDDVD